MGNGKRRRRWVAALLAAIVASAAAPAGTPGLRAAAPSPATVLLIDGDPDNYPTLGAGRTLLPPDHPMDSWLHSATGIGISVADIDPAFGSAGWWSWDFTVPTGQAITPGTYETASPGSPTGAGASFTGMSRGCNGSQGDVTIHEYSIDAGSDALLTLAATFKLGCAGSASSAYGEIRYNSAIPWATITPSPTSVAFGADPIGGAAVERTVTFASGGNGPLHVSAATLDGADAAAYTIISDTCTGAAVPSGSTCAITVAFNAVAGLGGEASLVIASDTARGTTRVALGAQPAPSLSASPGSVEFGTVGMLRSATRTVNLAYAGDGSLAITGFDFAPTWLGDPTDFSIASETCTAAPIPSGSGCEAVIRYAPSAEVQQEAVVAAVGPTLGPDGAFVAVVRGQGGPYVAPVAWGATTGASPSSAWNDGGALGRTAPTSTSQTLHLASTTDRVGGKWVTNSGPRMGVQYARSSSGSTWGTPRRLNATSAHGYWPSLAATGRTVHVAWVQSAKVYGVSATAPRVLYVRRNTNHGASSAWASTRRITSTSGRIDHPSIAAYGKRVLITWTDSATGSIKVALSKDGGSTFATSTVGSTTRSTSLGRSGAPQIAISGSTAIVAWKSNRDGALKARISTSSGSSWGTTTTVSQASNFGHGVAASSGRAAVAMSLGDVYVRSWKGGWDGGWRSMVGTGGAYQFQYTPAVALRGSAAIGVAWAGCANTDYVDCSEPSSATRVNLEWAESPDGGLHWSYGSPISMGSSSSARRVNEVPSVVWSTRRHVVWNGTTPGTNYYRLYAIAGTTATVPAVSSLVVRPLVPDPDVVTDGSNDAACPAPAPGATIPDLTVMGGDGC